MSTLDDDDRPRLPTRSNSQARGPPPADASAPDDKAIEDVYRQVSATGSLEAAAVKLQRAAQAQAQRMRWEDDPEEAGYLASTSGGADGDEHAVDDEDYDYDYDDPDADAEMEYGEEDGAVDTVVHLQEIVEGLWVGDLVAAMDADGLEARGISNILSLLRPRLSFSPEFAVYPLEIDDSPDSDILSHLPVCVAWIAEALRAREAWINHSQSLPLPREKLIERLPPTKAGGVLVHCQAGMSRSATVAAAYVMVALGLGPEEAVEMVRERRPVIDPSDTFRHQLALFSNANGKVSLKDRSTRQFYMERTTSQFINGDGSAPPMDKMAKYPATPTPSQPPTPSGVHGRRKIRCKSCRRLLAVREHMMDHILDQAPISRPRTPSLIALPSPRLGATGSNSGGGAISRKNSISDMVNPLTGLPGATARSRHSSISNGGGGGVIAGMTPLHESAADIERDREMSEERGAGGGVEEGGVPGPRRRGSIRRKDKPSMEGLRLSSAGATPPMVESPGSMGTGMGMKRSKSQDDKGSARGSGSSSGEGRGGGGGRTLQSADQLTSRLPPQLLALRNASGGGAGGGLSPPIVSPPAVSPERESSPAPPNSTGVAGAARRMSLLALTPTDGTRVRRASSASIGAGGASSPLPSGGAGSGSGSGSGDTKPPHALSGLESLATGGGGVPILVNPKCSGYFVEPLTWMEPFLRNGDIGGKIICPNEKCGAKIGNYDWAGVQCGCKEWVTPGFCIHKSKVDEVW